MVYVTACCQQTCMTPDDRQRNCLKHVEFYSKNKFEELVHLVGFIIRIYHDARSPECQILTSHHLPHPIKSRGLVEQAEQHGSCT